MKRDDLKPLSYRIADAVRVTGLSRSKLYDMAQKGQLQIVKIGGVSVIRREDLEALLQVG